MAQILGYYIPMSPYTSGIYENKIIARSLQFGKMKRHFFFPT